MANVLLDTGSVVYGEPVSFTPGVGGAPAWYELTVTVADHPGRRMVFKSAPQSYDFNGMQLPKFNGDTSTEAIKREGISASAAIYFLDNPAIGTHTARWENNITHGGTGGFYSVEVYYDVDPTFNSGTDTNEAWNSNGGSPLSDTITVPSGGMAVAVYNSSAGFTSVNSGETLLAGGSKGASACRADATSMGFSLASASGSSQNSLCILALHPAVPAGLTVSATPGNATAAGVQAAIGLSNVVHATPGNAVAAGVQASIGLGSPKFTTDAWINNSGSAWSAQAVRWSWFPGGRIGALAGITPVEGTGTTQADGTFILTSTMAGGTGAGVLMGTVRQTSASDDYVYYQAGTIV